MGKVMFMGAQATLIDSTIFTKKSIIFTDYDDK